MRCALNSLRYNAAMESDITEAAKTRAAFFLTEAKERLIRDPHRYDTVTRLLCGSSDIPSDITVHVAGRYLRQSEDLSGGDTSDLPHRLQVMVWGSQESSNVRSGSLFFIVNH